MFRMVQLVDNAKDIPATGVVVIDFFATWCGPCKKIAPMYEQMANLYPSVVFLKVDVDESNEIAEAYDIRAMPTFVVLKDGARIGEVEGADLRSVGAILDRLGK